MQEMEEIDWETLNNIQMAKLFQVNGRMESAIHSNISIISTTCLMN